MPEFRVQIDLKDVTGGDADSLAERIIEDYGDDYDVKLGDMAVTVLQKQGSAYFMRDPGDDDLR